MAITGIFHINLNCRDYERSRRFYEALGFRIERDFPEGGHPAVSEGLGVGDHRVKGALMAIGADGAGARLDLLEWIRPSNPGKATATLTDPGFVRIALWTDDFAGDVEKLRGLGAEFISEPIMVAGEHGPRPMLVCVRDPDGNVLELIPAPRRPTAAAS